MPLGGYLEFNPVSPVSHLHAMLFSGLSPYSVCNTQIDDSLTLFNKDEIISVAIQLNYQ